MSNFFSGFSLPVILVALGFAIIPSIFWMVIYFNKSQVPAKRAIATFFFGMLSVLPVLLIDHFFNVNGKILMMLNGATLVALVSSVWVGVSEEYSKHITTDIIDGHTKDFDQVIDGMTYSICAALGFAFVENIKFFLIGFDRYGFISMSFVTLFVFRMVGSTLAHTLFSGIYGYYYGKAKFARFHRKEEGYTRRHNFFHGGFKLRFHRLMHFFGIKHFSHDFRRHVRQEEILAEGLIIATLIHAMFDFALSVQQAILVVPMLFIEYSIIAHEFKCKQNREVYVTDTGGKQDDEHKQMYEDGYAVDNEHLHNAHHIGKATF